MRVCLMMSPALVSHSGPRRLARFVGLSSPVIMRRRIGYLTNSATIERPIDSQELQSYTKPHLNPSA